MCGIFGYLTKYANVDEQFIRKQFLRGQHRGPESTVWKKMETDYHFFMGFHRLAINGLNNKSNQPFDILGVQLVCNGEIYNYRELYKALKVKPRTGSDCEVIIYLYLMYGIEYTLNALDGVFSFILFDSNAQKIYISRDPYGVRPLYECEMSHGYAFGSELKQLHLLGGKVRQFEPGTYKMYGINKTPVPFFSFYKTIEIPTLIETTRYTTFPFKTLNFGNINEVYTLIYDSLYEAVRKRTLGTTERRIACLLSGGLDSSTIAAMVNSFLEPGQLETYSIGLPDSVDLVCAKKVADYLGTKHTEIIVSEEDFFNAIPEVIKVIESYDTTTVRASVGNYLIGKYITEKSDAKVIFNGDGSDELTGGYLYFNSVPDTIEFDKECKRLLREIHVFDVLRSDKCISSNGLEPRTPFLDRGFVETYLSVPIDIRCSGLLDQPEKFLLRKSIEYSNPKLLPPDILWRTKEAFSDGVSGHSRSWYQIIKERTIDIDIFIDPNINFNKPLTKEMEYYRSIFDNEYPCCSKIVPYFWMPKYTNATDPSARTIKEYKP